MSEWDLPSGVQNQTIERVGGGYAWESAVYDANIDMVYLTQAKSGAIGFNVVMKNTEGKELKETFWIKSGKEKGNKTYYTKDGKDYPLLGYSVANSLCIAATGESLAKSMTNAQKKTVEIYDHSVGKEVPTEVPVLMGLTNKPVKVAVHQVKEDKRKKNDATGQYESTGETKIVNECKFFGNTAGQTADEIVNKEEATMFTKWGEKNTGKVVDKSTEKVAGSSAADIMGGTATTPDAAAPASNLFS